MRFPFIAALDGGDHQVVFAFEMFVESGLGYAGRGDDPVDADGRAEAVAIEKFDGCAATIRSRRVLGASGSPKSSETDFLCEMAMQSECTIM